VRPTHLFDVAVSGMWREGAASTVKITLTPHNPPLFVWRSTRSLPSYMGDIFSREKNEF